MGTPAIFLRLAALLGFLGVAAGAFGAHALAERLSPRDLDIFQTGARYQLAHALALVGAAWAATRWPGRAVRIAGWSFALGVLVFSGSLYALVLSGVRTFGAITPIGGLLLLVGWAALGWATFGGGSNGSPSVDRL